MKKALPTVFITVVFLAMLWSSAVAVNPHVVLETSSGPMVLELFPDDSPLTVANFLDYVDHNFYDGLIFHRVIEDFVIQTGGYDVNLVPAEPNDPIVGESHLNDLRNEKYSIAMALTSDPNTHIPDPNSGDSQFYINLKDNPDLDPGGYTVFGRVAAGMDVVDEIAAVDVHNTGGLQNVPVSPIIINDAHRLDLDLVIAEPNSLTISVEPLGEVTFPVEMINLGDADAFDTLNPQEPFLVTAYLAQDPCLTDADSVADFFCDFLAARSSTNDANEPIVLTFIAPATRGTYYLYAQADDANQIIEFDETNNRGSIVTLEVNYEPNDVEITRFVARAGPAAGRDRFFITGAFQPTPHIQQTDALAVDVYVGPYSKSLSCPWLRNSIFLYRNPSSDIRLVLIDLDRGRFLIAARRVDLTGLTAPVRFEIAFEQYRGIATVEEDIINGPRELPLRFNQGHADVLTVANFRLTTDRPYDSNNDSLIICGGIATQLDPNGLEGKPVTVEWGSRTFTIPAGSAYAPRLRRVGRWQHYVYHRTRPSDGDIIHASFNFATARFRIIIRKAALLSKPPQDFGISFEVADGVYFDQTVANVQ